MNKLIISVALIALASTAMVGSASAGKGNGNSIAKMPGIGPQVSQMQPGNSGKPGKGGKSYGGDASSPGDAFYPDTADVCEGKIVYRFDDSGNGQLVPFCIN